MAKKEEFILINPLNSDYGAIDRVTGELYLGHSGNPDWVAVFHSKEHALKSRDKYLPGKGLQAQIPKAA